MELGSGKCNNSDADLVEAQSHVWNHTLYYIHSMSLRCAIQLGIPDIINNHGRLMPLPELVSALSIHPDRTNFVQRLIPLLVHSGFFACKRIIGAEGEDHKDEGYVLTLCSRILLKGNPVDMSPMTLFLTELIMANPFHCLTRWLYKNETLTAFMEKHKKDYWDSIGQDAEAKRVMNEAMASDTPVVADALTDKCRDTFEFASSVLDVGGGTGGLARAIAAKFPHLECVVLDLPHVVGGLEEENNLRFVAGNMLGAIPPADAL